MKYLSGTSYRTSFWGVIAIIWGLRAALLVWVPTQTVYFNLMYVETGPMALIFTGLGLLFARDHKVSSKKAGLPE